MAGVSDEIIADYARVLGVKITQARAFVDTMWRQQGLDANTFRGYYKYLTAISLDDITGELTTFTRRTEVADEIKIPSTVDVVNPATGSYGKTYMSKGGNAYKALRISTHDEAEQAVRNVFVETFIQTVLSHDVYYGKYICKVDRLYRLEKNAIKPATYSCLIKMEGLYQNVNDLLAKKPRETVFIRNLAKLGEVLLHFDLNYKFRHQDMHYQNLMADKEGTLKIIDFGLACLRIGDHTYTTKSSKSECESYDSLLLFASLLEGNDRNWITLQPRTLNWIKGVFYMNPGNLYEDIKKTNTLKHVFHNMYYDNSKKWTQGQQKWLAQSDRFTPEGFMKMTHKYLYALECVERDASPCPKCGPVPLLPNKINVEACRRKRNTHRASAIRPKTKPRSATRRSPRSLPTIRLVAATNPAPVNAATGSTGAITRARAAAAYKAHDTPAIAAAAAAAEKLKKD